ncbi:GntR family transcriptional regulator [Streptomyces sp. NPDC093109]|uniref:GntR family transcriptional regulator n=1 Tax=Streptomyces sp. NPDC093109 TaxID=3154977 RepID=UPI00344B1839
MSPRLPAGRTAADPATATAARASTAAPEREPAADSGAQQYRQLRKDLVSGAIDPGSLLLETTLSARYGVSRTPIRDALGRLEQDGLVERVARGYRVRVATAEDILEIYEARISLEATAAGSAALRRTELDLARLTHHHQRLLEATEVTDVTSVNACFHEALWLAGHNATVAGLLDRLVTQMRLFDRAPTAAPENRELTHEEHERILRAVREHDPEAARREVAAHLGRNRDVRLAGLARHPL